MKSQIKIPSKEQLASGNGVRTTRKRTRAKALKDFNESKTQIESNDIFKTGFNMGWSACKRWKESSEERRKTTSRRIKR